MDYEQLTQKQLQDECRRRGLPTGRMKAEMVQRLADYDVAQADDGTDDFDEPIALPPAEAQTANAPDGPDPEMPAPVGPSTPGVHQCRFPAKSEGPTEPEHADYRRRTLDDAVALGLNPRGDAYRTGTVDGFEVYEVRVRGRS